MIAANKWAIVSDDYEKVKKAVVSAIHGRESWIVCNWSSRNGVHIEFRDGVELDWFRASGLKKSERFSRLWCDSEIDQDVLKEVVLGCCYLGRKGDIAWI